MACDFRIAAESAVFGQPEINLGSSRLRWDPALPRLVGPSKALEMNLTGDAVLAPKAYELGPRQPRGPRPGALRHRRRLGPEARGAGADRRRADQEGLVKGDLDEGIEAEQGFATAFLSEDAKEGISAFLGQAPVGDGRGSER